MSGEAHIKSLIDRILRLKEEQDALGDDIRGIYAEAKSQGYDKTALGEVVAYLRKVEKKGRDAVDERSAIFDLYLTAYEQPSHALAYARTRKNSFTEQPKVVAPDHASNPQPDGDAFSEVKGTARPENAAGVEPSSSGIVSPSAATAAEAVAESQALQAPATAPHRWSELRPHCLNPGCCAGVGHKHCHTCTKALAESEAA